MQNERHSIDAIDREIEILQIQREMSRLERMKAARVALSERQQAYVAAERRLQAARENCATMLETVIKDAYSNAPIVLQPIHYSWLEHIQYCWSHGLHAWILAPFGHGKTSIILGLILYLLGRDQNLRIKIICSNRDEAGKRLGAIKDYIEKDVDYRRVFPAVRRDPTGTWATWAIRVLKPTISKDDTIEAYGAATGGQGMRSDLNFYDDMNDRRNTLENPALRDKVFGSYLSTYHTRLEDNRLALGISTRWHEHDVIGRIMADAKMRQSYGILIQRISLDFERIDCSAYYGDAAVSVESEYANAINLCQSGTLDPVTV